jgi:hypothetical protein
MKKIITLLSLLTISVNSFSQAINGTVTVRNTNPSMVCSGAVIPIKFRFDYNVPITDPDQRFYFEYIADNLVLYPGFSLSIPEILALPREFNAVFDTDSMYVYNLVVNKSIPKDHYMMYARPNKVFGTGKSFKISACVGIEEYEINNQYQPVYYDLMGNKINRRTGELIIEQIGTHRRKILIQE